MVFGGKIFDCPKWGMVVLKIKHPRNSGFTIRIFFKLGSIKKIQLSVQNHFIGFPETSPLSGKWANIHLKTVLWFYFILRNKDGRAVMMPNDYSSCFLITIGKMRLWSFAIILFLRLFWNSNSDKSRKIVQCFRIKNNLIRKGLSISQIKK